MTTTRRPYGNAFVGDLHVAGLPDDRLARALTVIASLLHEQFGKGWQNTRYYMPEGQSQKSCILCSITVRDFLYRVGFRDAKVRSVEFHIAEHLEPGSGINGPDQRAVSRVLVIGADDDIERPGHWKGHAVVTTGNWLIDTTLYQATPRPEWPDFPPMWAVKMQDDLPLAQSKSILHEGFRLFENQHVLHWMWMDRPDRHEAWARFPDYREKWRRERVVDAMVATYRESIDV